MWYLRRMSAQNLETIVKQFTLKKLPDSEVELTGEVPFEALAPYRSEAIEHISDGVELPGFRKGHVPTEMLIKKVGEIAILEESVEHLMRDFYPLLITEHKLEAIGRPTVAITKLAPGNPVGLTVRTTLFPTFDLPDYKKIAKSITKEPAKDISPEDIKTAVDAVRASHAKEKDEKGAPILPEVTDEWVKTLGDFKDVMDFDEKLKGHLTTEQEQKAKEKHRIKVTEAVMEKTNIDIPKIFVESELDKMLGQMREDVKRFGMTFEDYLSRSKKTENDIRKDFAEDAKKRAKLQLTLNAIAEKENIVVPAEEIEKEAQHIIEHFKDADRERVHIYVESVIKNEKVLSMLESQN